MRSKTAPARVMTRRPDSRTASDELLGVLRDGRWRPQAWAEFLRRPAQRSVQQAVEHPRELIEVTLGPSALAAI